MSFPILSSLIVLPTVGAIFILFGRPSSNYNAAKYIQSRDRIHRVGSPFAEVNFFFYESIHPRKHELIDRKISENLSSKLALFNQIFKDKDIFKMQEF